MSNVERLPQSPEEAGECTRLLQGRRKANRYARSPQNPEEAVGCGSLLRNRGGYATLYLTLLLGILTGFFLFLLSMARQQTMKLEAECVIQTALESVFAEYNRPLLERYDLFFVDTAYGTGNPSLLALQQRLRQYMNHNFGRVLPGIRLTALRSDAADIRQYSLATDRNGQVLKRQAVSYEKDRTGIALAEGIWEWSKKLAQTQAAGKEQEARKEAVDSQIEEIRYQRQKKEDGTWEERILETPADGIGIETALARTALGSSQAVSGLTIPVEQLASHRSRQSGNGFWQEREGLEEVLDQGLFTAYLLEHCSYFGKQREDTPYQYQIEYILKGKPAESDNLEAVCRDIFLIRYGMNMAHLMSDSAKKSQAEVIATAAAVLIWKPEAASLIENAILLAWGYAESVQDLRILLDGQQVPFQKSSTSWQISLVELPWYKSRLGNYQAFGGNSYREYLAAFLFLQEQEIQNLRLADMIEADIRLQPGYESFRLDGCLDSVQVQVQVSSGYGSAFSLERSYGYISDQTGNQPDE